MPPERPKLVTAADVTRAYIDEHPSIREALKDDLLNYTAIARKLMAERDLRHEEAITIACRRYQRDLIVADPPNEAVQRVLSRSRLQVHSHIALVRIRDDSELIDRLLSLARRTLPALSGRRVFEVLQGTRATTIVCEESYLTTLLPEIPVRLRVAVEHGLAILAFRSGAEVAETPGVLSHIAEALYRRGINCLETVSVHTDSIFVFRDRDVIPAYQALSDLVPSPGLGPPPGDGE